MSRQPEPYDDDDGRVICSMNVEGMHRYGQGPRREETAMRTRPRGMQMTRSEMRRYNFYSLLAALLIVLVFSVTWVLFTLFCTQIWFR